MGERRCATCRFWDGGGYEDDVTAEDVPLGLCRRNPPSLPDAGGDRFPETRADDWCGQWEAVPNG